MISDLRPEVKGHFSFCTYRKSTRPSSLLHTLVQKAFFIYTAFYFAQEKTGSDHHRVVSQSVFDHADAIFLDFFFHSVDFFDKLCYNCVMTSIATLLEYRNAT